MYIIRLFVSTVGNQYFKSKNKLEGSTALKLSILQLIALLSNIAVQFGLWDTVLQKGRHSTCKFLLMSHSPK